MATLKANALRRYPAAASLPVVSDALHAPALAGRLATDFSCVKASVAQGPGPSVAYWWLWEGPVLDDWASMIMKGTPLWTE
jgi:hypothetical protein